MKSDVEIARDLEGKTLDIFAIDEYMTKAGYESILPADEQNIRDTELIWYPFEPYPSQVNLLVKSVDDQFFIEHVETTRGQEETAEHEPAGQKVTKELQKPKKSKAASRKKKKVKRTPAAGR